MNRTAQGIASKGRFGDSMLVHMAPSEVAGVASLGGVSVNPSTGLPEMFKFKDFLKIALPVAGSILAPQLLLAQGAGALATGVAAGGGSALGTLLAGGNKEEALQSGLLTGLTAGIGSKLASGAGGVTEATPQKFSIDNELIKGGANIQGGTVQTGIQNAASTSSAPLSFGESFNPATTGGEIAERTGELFTKGNIGSTLGRGAAGVVGAMGSQTPDIVEQERRRRDIQLSGPYTPQVSFPSADFTGSSEYRYFNPNSLYAKDGGHIKQMQEGGIASLPQTEGQVEGRGDGMDDEVFGDIEGEQEVALSKDEFIVPADVVAGLGNGSSNAGASQLYEMMDRVRMARTGKKTQPPEIEAREFLPA